MKLHDYEWQLVLAAYMYEVHNISIMSDSQYDKLSLMPNKIPGFDINTGLWIHEFRKRKGIQSILNRALDQYKDIGAYEGTHPYILIAAKHRKDSKQDSYIDNRWYGRLNNE